MAVSFNCCSKQERVCKYHCVFFENICLEASRITAWTAKNVTKLSHKRTSVADFGLCSLAPFIKCGSEVENVSVANITVISLKTSFAHDLVTV